MSIELIAGLIGALAAIIGACLTGLFDYVRTYRVRPILLLEFERDDAFIVESTYLAHDKERSSKFVRVRLRNVGNSVARDCRVYLTNIEEVRGPQIHPTTLYDSKPLPWAGYPPDTSSRALPKGINAFIDVIRFSKDDRIWHFQAKPFFASQVSIRDYTGTYRVTVVATADNAAPVTLSFHVEFDGEYDRLRASATQSVR